MNDGLVEIDLTTLVEGVDEDRDRAGQAEESGGEEAARRGPSNWSNRNSSLRLRARSRPSPGKNWKSWDQARSRRSPLTAGIELPPRTRTTTYIDAILGEGKAGVDEEVEFSDTVTVTGSSNMMGSITLMGGTLQGNAMLLVIANGTVTSRTITEEEAAALLR